MNIEEISPTSALYAKAFDLRYALFFEAFDLPKSVTADDMEGESTHVAISEADTLIAYGRLSPLEPDVYRISQIVVPVELRGNGYATLLLKKIIEIAKIKGATKIQLNAQITAVELYSKLGFKPIGDIYKVKLTGLEHIKMAYSVKS